MNTYADAAELAWSELKRKETAPELPRRAPRTERDFVWFFREKVIPEVKRAALEINAAHSGLHAKWAFFPNEDFPYSVELLLSGPWMRMETFLSFRLETDDFCGAEISWYTSDNPICKRMDAPRLEMVEELIVKFVGSVFNRITVAAGD